MRITDVIVVSCCNSSKFIRKCWKMFLYIIALFSTTLIASTLSTPTFSPSSTTELRRLTVDPLTGTVYVGAVNHLYQLDNNLNLVVDVGTGPVQDDTNCPFFDRTTGELECTNLQLSLTDNDNQVIISFLLHFTFYRFNDHYPSTVIFIAKLLITVHRYVYSVILLLYYFPPVMTALFVWSDPGGRQRSFSAGDMWICVSRNLSV